MSRQTINFNSDWEFQLNTTPERSLWAACSLPHDWSVEHPFEKRWDGATGYLPGGMGWYRKRFDMPKLPPNQRIFMVFEGIYNNSEVRLNGHLLARHPYGYSPLKLDITDYLDAHNELIVQVDRRRHVDSRWYTGSGIYRDVSMIIVNAAHIRVWENAITATPLSQQSASIKQSLMLNLPDYLTVVNEQTIQIKTSIFECDKGSTKLVQSHHHTLTHDDVERVTQSLPVGIEFCIDNPKLWSPDCPNLYQVHTQLIVGDVNRSSSIMDDDVQPMGIRTLHFDSNLGFYLNGQPTKIKGVCLHHDGGLVGAAVPNAVWRRRLNALKQAGVNAIRSAHNPASLPFLHLCDEIGLLVQEEFFDEWDNPKDKRLNMGEQHDDFESRGYTEHFQNHAESDLKSTLQSRINHPCIFMWSIGNEIEWTYPRNVKATGFFNASWDGNYFWSLPPHSPEQIKEQLNTLPTEQYDIGETAQKLSRWVKELDTSRPVTANCILPSASYLSGYADALDVIGFSYRRVIYDYGREHYPNLPIIGNENLGQWHEWKAVLERNHVSGVFLWTGINYMGESHGQWPTRTTDSGLLDAAGFKKPSHAMFKSLWVDEPVLELFTQRAVETDFVIDPSTYTAQEADPHAWESKLWQWPERQQHWNFQQDEMVVVEVYSNCEEVELFLNDQSLGKRKLADQADHIMRWAVPFTDGTLTARSCSLTYLPTQSLCSSASLSAVQIDVEHSVKDGEYRHVILSNRDSINHPVRHQQATYQITLDGGEIVGVDNGAKDNLQPYQSNVITTHKGHALVLIKCRQENAEITVTQVVDSVGDDPITSQMTIG
jgi:hypothetical protein